MMLRANLAAVIPLTLILVAALYLIIPLKSMSDGEPHLLAVAAHEDPETADEVFSGTASFIFDSDVLNFILDMKPEEVEAMLEERPFSRVPESLKQPVSDFIAASTRISHLVVAIDKDVDNLGALREQLLATEAAELADEIAARLSEADSELNRIEQATEAADAEFKASSAPAGSDLRRAYGQVIERIDRIRGMLAAYNDLLADPPEVEEPLSSVEEPLNSTDIILETQLKAASMGESVHFSGVLTSENGPLVGREIDILINSYRFLAVKTDDQGRYQGKLRIPYWYLHQLDVQALYSPQDTDRDIFLASLSPVIKVEALFYETGLEVTLEDEAYPGLETTLAGRFDYGQSPPRSRRKVEIYFDDTLIIRGTAEEAFSQRIAIDPETGLGKHTVTISSAATGRYSSAVTSAILNITRTSPILDLTVPNVAIIPGSLDLDGRLYSEIGALNGAAIRMGLGKSRHELMASEDGTFDTKMKLGMSFGVIGSQDLAIQVLPEEPWHAPLNTTVRVLVVNAVNAGGFLVILVVLGVYLPAWLRRRLAVYPRRRARPAVVAARPAAAPAYSESMLVPGLGEEDGRDTGEPRNRIFYRYRLIVRLIQRISQALLRPQQTLREFARESSRLLGPAGRYFVELTRTVERLLYSKYRPTEGDVERSQRLSHSIEERLKT